MKPVLRIFLSVLVVCAAIGVAPAVAIGQSSSDSVGDDPFPVTLTDATGTEVTIEERPERVTTTNPSAAQVMWELGAESQVVGLTQFALYLDGAETRENVSSTEFGVSVERVVGTEPDLVLAPSGTSEETVETLRDAGLTVYSFPQETDFADVADKTLRIGLLTGNTDAAIETNAWMDANVEAISSATADAERPRLMYPLPGDFTVGGDTFIDEIITASGAENVFSAEFTGYEQPSRETVLELDPAVLILTDQPGGVSIENEPYSLTTAGETNSSVFLTVNYLNQPAPRSVVYSTRNLTAQLHPDRYDENDFVSRTDAADSVDLSAERAAANELREGDRADDADGEGETFDSAPGFGVVVTAVAALLATLITRRHAVSLI